MHRTNAIQINTAAAVVRYACGVVAGAAEAEVGSRPRRLHEYQSDFETTIRPSCIASMRVTSTVREAPSVDRGYADIIPQIYGRQCLSDTF